MDKLYAQLIEEARERWGRATPLRIGYLAGLKGLHLVNPYPRPKGQKSFADGMNNGVEERARTTAEIGKETP